MQGVDLPADRHLEHLEADAHPEQGQPPQSEIALLEAQANPVSTRSYNAPVDPRRRTSASTAAATSSTIPVAMNWPAALMPISAKPL